MEKMNCIIIPCYNRPDKLCITLKFLKSCYHIDNYKIIFAIDGGYDRKIDDVISKYFNKSTKLIRNKHYGLTKNILEGMKTASKLSDDYFIVIEEDIKVSKDFLMWHEYVYKNMFDKNTLSSTGFTIEKKDVKDVVFSNWYYPWGTLIPIDKFNKYILSHCNEEYYKDHYRYVMNHFPFFINIMNSIWNQQAGLIQRIKMKYGLGCLMPRMSRVEHIGVSHPIDNKYNWDILEFKGNSIKDYINLRRLSSRFYKWVGSIYAN